MKYEYFYPNEVDVFEEDGKRYFTLKENWKEIRRKNERIDDDDNEQLNMGQ